MNTIVLFFIIITMVILFFIFTSYDEEFYDNIDTFLSINSLRRRYPYSYPYFYTYPYFYRNSAGYYDPYIWNNPTRYPYFYGYPYY